jgi:acetyltransferase-like isoleucine patch superfamily enzyme
VRHLTYPRFKPSAATKLIAAIENGFFLHMSGMSIGRGSQVWEPVIIKPLYLAKRIKIKCECFVDSECRFSPRDGIEIQGNVAIGPRVCLETVTHSLDVHQGGRRSTVFFPIKIKNSAWLCTASIVLPGITIGENSVLAAGGIATKNIPACQIWGGVSSRLIKNFS